MTGLGTVVVGAGAGLVVLPDVGCMEVGFVVVPLPGCCSSSCLAFARSIAFCSAALLCTGVLSRAFSSVVTFFDIVVLSVSRSFVASLVVAFCVDAVDGLGKDFVVLPVDGCLVVGLVVVDGGAGNFAG